MKTLILTALLIGAQLTHADCVFGAKSKTSYSVVSPGTIILKGYFGSDILVKTYSIVSSHSDITVLKDSFCSYESNVLLIDGSVADVTEVKGL